MRQSKRRPTENFIKDRLMEFSHQNAVKEAVLYIASLRQRCPAFRMCEYDIAEWLKTEPDFKKLAAAYRASLRPSIIKGIVVRYFEHAVTQVQECKRWEL